MTPRLGKWPPFRGGGGDKESLTLEPITKVWNAPITFYPTEPGQGQTSQVKSLSSLKEARYDGRISSRLHVVHSVQAHPTPFDIYDNRGGTCRNAVQERPFSRGRDIKSIFSPWPRRRASWMTERSADSSNLKGRLDYPRAMRLKRRTKPDRGNRQTFHRSIP